MIELILAIVLVTTFHVLQGNIGLNMADEGFLWNGVLRIGQGKVPIRDYKSYDPGRFYWTFIWAKVFGTGIIGIRCSVAVFQAMGLLAGLLTLNRQTDEIWWLTMAAIMLLWWMQPRHKIFEHAICLIAIYTGVVLLETPTIQTLFLAGVFVGLAGFMGRNHGVYTFAAFATLILVLWLKGETESLAIGYSVWLVGIVAGYSPMLAMWLFIPNMFTRYWNDKVLVFTRRGTANLPLPIPWPWRAQYTQPRLRDRLAQFFLGAHFVFLPLFYVVALGWVFAAPTLAENPVLTASAAVGIFYVHHAFSRADLAHLCQSIQPFLIGAFAIAFAQPNPATTLAVTGIILISGYLTARPLVPFMNKWENRSSFVEFDVQGDKLWIDKSQAQLLGRLRAFADQHVASNEEILIAPVTPTLYPVLGKQTPVHSDYLLFPETENVQRATIQDLENNKVKWSLIQDYALDGRDDLRFCNTHPLVWDYLQNRFDTVPLPGIDKSWRMFVRNDSLPQGVQHPATA